MKILFTLVIILFGATASYASIHTTNENKALTGKSTSQTKEEKTAKDTVCTKRKEDKSFKQVMLSMLLRFE